VACTGLTGTPSTGGTGDARPGEEILLAPGTYDGNFTASHSGTSAAPVTLCGPRSAVLDGGSVSRGYVFYLDHASWWRLIGFTSRTARRECLHDTVSHCMVRDAGPLVHFFGEGRYTHCQPG
jgi:hypothetical protein